MLMSAVFVYTGNAKGKLCLLACQLPLNFKYFFLNITAEAEELNCFFNEEHLTISVSQSALRQSATSLHSSNTQNCLST